MSSPSPSPVLPLYSVPLASYLPRNSSPLSSSARAVTRQMTASSLSGSSLFLELDDSNPSSTASNSRSSSSASQGELSASQRYTLPVLPASVLSSAGLAPGLSGSSSRGNQETTRWTGSTLTSAGSDEFKASFKSESFDYFSCSRLRYSSYSALSYGSARTTPLTPMSPGTLSPSSRSPTLALPPRRASDKTLSVYLMADPGPPSEWEMGKEADDEMWEVADTKSSAGPFSSARALGNTASLLLLILCLLSLFIAYPIVDKYPLQGFPPSPIDSKMTAGFAVGIPSSVATS